MKQNLKIAILMTIVTTVLLGLIYPLVVTGLAQLLFRDKANGQLLSRNGEVIGSRIIGQAFVGPGYLHSRLSAAGNGYDAANSGGTNFGPTNHLLIDRVKGDVTRLQAENPGQPVPIDLVTTSASGLDPDITPAAAEFQVLATQSRTWPKRRPGAPDHSPIHRGAAAWISGRAARQRVGSESRAGPSEANAGTHAIASGGGPRSISLGVMVGHHRRPKASEI